MVITYINEKIYSARKSRLAAILHRSSTIKSRIKILRNKHREAIRTGADESKIEEILTSITNELEVLRQERIRLDKSCEFDDNLFIYLVHPTQTDTNIYK